MIDEAHHGFGSTYEGLKPQGVPPRGQPVPGFGSTYEGLKQDVRKCHEPAQDRFGSTYEGLKLLTIPGIVVAVPLVLAVPMRA